MIAAWALAHWKDLGAAALVVFLVFALWFTNRRAMVLSTENGALIQKIEQCRVIEAEQARARDEWKRRTAEAEARAATAAERVAQVRVVHDRQLIKVATVPIAPTCEGAIRYMAEQARELGTWLPED